MRWLIVTWLLAVLILASIGGLVVVRDQAELRAHLEQRDARHKEIQAWLDDVEQARK